VITKRLDVDLTGLFHDEAVVTVSAAPSGYVLEWNDGVANEWVEEYPTLSAALARAAALAACMESGWERSFMADPEVFTQRVTTFMNEEALTG